LQLRLFLLRTSPLRDRVTFSLKEPSALLTMASFTSPTAALRTTSMALLFLLLALVLAPIARAAPAGFDYAALLRNGQEAQQLNALYPTLSAEDACTGELARTDQLGKGEARILKPRLFFLFVAEAAKACVGDVPAQCTKGRWSLATTTCPDSQHCFALPSVRQSGTVSLHSTTHVTIP
jgi:hypothetical protein